MGRYFFRFLSLSLLALETRLQHQSNERSFIKVHIGQVDIDCCIYDSLLPQASGPTLFRGLGIDMYATEDEGQAKAFCERLLALLSYVHMTPCHPALLEMSYDASAEKQDRAFMAVSYSLDVEARGLRKVDSTLLNAVFDGHHFDDDAKWLALEWFRKGLAEQYAVDEFIAYWSALEILAGSLERLYSSAGEKSYTYCPHCKEAIVNCPHCQHDAGKVSPWAGVFHLVEKEIGVTKSEFKVLRKFRGGMLHGGAALTIQKVEMMKSRELPILRRLVSFALSEVFNFSRESAERIANNTVHRSGVPVALKQFGTLNLDAGEPPGIENFGLQPFLEVREKNKRYTFGRDGKMTFSVDVECKAIGGSFKLVKRELWADVEEGRIFDTPSA